MKTTIDPYFRTGNYSIATTLKSLGFGWVDDKAPCTNTYSKDEPIKKSRQGVPVNPGNVTFYVDRQSKEFRGLLAEDITDQWKDGGADSELDSLMALDPADSKEVRDLKARFLELFPLALVCYMKSCLSNRRIIAGLFRSVEPTRCYEEDGWTYSYSDNASEETRRKLGA